MSSQNKIRNAIKPPFLALLVCLIAACQTQPLPIVQAKPIVPSASPATTKTPRSIANASPTATLIDIRTVNPNILLDLRYATADNFLRTKVYPVARCLLRVKVAQQLSHVQIDLERQGLGLKVYDCYRPLSVQKQMWQVKPDRRYVADPKFGSRHNRGSAIDVTLVNRKGEELEMPSAFDEFTERAHLDYDGASATAKKNRQLLQTVMKKYGFVPLATEWWHFDAQDWQDSPVLDVPLEFNR